MPVKLQLRRHVRPLFQFGRTSTRLPPRFPMFSLMGAAVTAGWTVAGAQHGFRA